MTRKGAFLEKIVKKLNGEYAVLEYHEPYRPAGADKEASQTMSSYTRQVGNLQVSYDDINQEGEIVMIGNIDSFTMFFEYTDIVSYRQTRDCFKIQFTDRLIEIHTLPEACQNKIQPWRPYA